MGACSGIPDKTTSSWDYGVWLGRCTQSDEHFVGTKDNIYRTRTVRRLPEKDKYDVKLLEAIVSTPWATRGVGEAPTVEFVLPLPVPPPFDYKTKSQENIETKEEATAETNTTTEPNPSRTTVNVETGGTYQEEGATSSGTTRGTTRPSEVEQELPAPKRQHTQGATSPTEEPRGSIRGPDALPDDDVREHKSRMIEALHKQVRTNIKEGNYRQPKYQLVISTTLETPKVVTTEEDNTMTLRRMKRHYVWMNSGT